jgi:CRISPR-associated endonuclease/helicase Cas3
MCPQHRLDVIAKMRDAMKAGVRVVCVSTQLIEAGVDISFGCVVRAMAGLDSIAQAAGRCNRSKESLTEKEVYVVSIEDEKLGTLETIKIAKSVAENVIAKNLGHDLLSEEIIGKYYRDFYNAEKNQLDYPIKNSINTIYKLLSTNDLEKKNCVNLFGMIQFPAIPCAFKTASNNYSVISKEGNMVIVPYKEANSLFEQFKNTYKSSDKVKLLRKMARYSVSLFKKEFDDLFDAGNIELADKEFGIYRLNHNFYKDGGVVFDLDYENFVI